MPELTWFEAELEACSDFRDRVVATCEQIVRSDDLEECRRLADAVLADVYGDTEGRSA